MKLEHIFLSIAALYSFDFSNQQHYKLDQKLLTLIFNTDVDMSYCLDCEKIGNNREAF